jgi:hypothetical protein
VTKPEKSSTYPTGSLKIFSSLLASAFKHGFSQKIVQFGLELRQEYSIPSSLCGKFVTVHEVEMTNVVLPLTL